MFFTKIKSRLISKSTPILFKNSSVNFTYGYEVICPLNLIFNPFFNLGPISKREVKY